VNVRTEKVKVDRSISTFKPGDAVYFNGEVRMIVESARHLVESAVYTVDLETGYVERWRADTLVERANVDVIHKVPGGEA
jgi:hypothetical protein